MEDKIKQFEKFWNEISSEMEKALVTKEILWYIWRHGYACGTINHSTEENERLRQLLDKMRKI